MYVQGGLSKFPATNKKRNPNIVRPRLLNLPQVTTNEEGRIRLDLKDLQLYLGDQDQVTLAFLETPLFSFSNLNPNFFLQLKRVEHGNDHEVLPEIVGGTLEFASTQALQDLTLHLYHQKLVSKGNNQKWVTDQIWCFQLVRLQP